MFWNKMNANISFNAAIERLWITSISMKFKTRLYEKEGWRRVDKAKAINKITVILPKEKVDFINDTH